VEIRWPAEGCLPKIVRAAVKEVVAPRPQDNPPTSWSNFGPKYDDIALVAVNQEGCARAERRNDAIEL